MDDVTIKSRSKDNHLHDLRMMFNIMQDHLLKMNMTKSFSGKCLLFIVTFKGIHLDLDKIKAI